MPERDWRESGFRQRRPSDDTFAWVAASLGRGSRVVGCRRLTGGVSSAVHRLTVEDDGSREFVILRQYPAGLGLDEALQRECTNLELVAGSGLPVPSIVAADVDGASTGGLPSLLMTCLPGYVDLDPAQPGRWLTRIAELAAQVHSLDLPAKAFDPWTDSWIAPRGDLHVPTDARRPDVWMAAFDSMTEPPPRDSSAFLHGDLLPVNLLWSQGRITGLVDWNGVHRGSPAIDIGHCRRYLAALHSTEWAEQLRSSYESLVGAVLDPWWDLYALLHYDDNQAKWMRRQVAGRCAVDIQGMTGRVESLIEAGLRRLE